MRRLIALAAALAAAVGILLLVLDESPAPVQGSETSLPLEERIAPPAEFELESPPASVLSPPPAPAAEERVAVLRVVISGRVVEEGSGAPVTGVEVELSRRAIVLERATSGADARFRFDAPDGTECALLVVERLGLTFPGPAVFVDLAQPSEEYVLRVRLTPTAPLAGRLVDVATDESVPFCPFELSRENGDGKDVLETDVEGRFQSSRSYRAGTLMIQLREPSRTAYHSTRSDPRIDHDPKGLRQHVIPVRVGPTYYLDFDLPSGVSPDAFTARLRSEKPDGRPWGLEQWQTPVRSGRLPWVRFAKASFAGDPNPPWRLSLGTDTWHGSARVDSITGIHLRPVRIELRQVGRLRGRLLDVTTKADWAFVELAREGAPLRVEGPFNDGTYSIDELEPGAYRVAAYSRRCARVAHTVTVEAGELTRHDVILLPRPVGGSIAGTVRSQTGARINDVRAVLRTPDFGKLVWTRHVLWPPGAEEGRFRFDDVPEGEYKVLLSIGIAKARVDPPEILVTPPRQDLYFLVRDDPDLSHSYRLRAVDAVTGECITEPQLESRRPPAMVGNRQWTSACWLDVTGAYGVGEHFEWVLRCDGYETAWGDETSFTVREGEGEDERWIHEARLRAGWSGRVRVVDEDGVPLVGASVRFDDGPVDSTGADGRVLAFRDARPERLSVTLGSRRVVGGDLDESGLFADVGFDIEVVMTSPE